MSEQEKGVQPRWTWGINQDEGLLTAGTTKGNALNLGASVMSHTLTVSGRERVPHREAPGYPTFHDVVGALQSQEVPSLPGAPTVLFGVLGAWGGESL